MQQWLDTAITNLTQLASAARNSRSPAKVSSATHEAGLERPKHEKQVAEDSDTEQWLIALSLQHTDSTTKQITHLCKEVLLQLVCGLLVRLVLLTALNQSVQVKSQVTNLVTELFTSVSPACIPLNISTC